jgi:hypothetical protein
VIQEFPQGSSLLIFNLHFLEGGVPWQLAKARHVSIDLSQPSQLHDSRSVFLIADSSSQEPDRRCNLWPFYLSKLIQFTFRTVCSSRSHVALCTRNKAVRRLRNGFAIDLNAGSTHKRVPHATSRPPFSMSRIHAARHGSDIQWLRKRGTTPGRSRWTRLPSENSPNKHSVLSAIRTATRFPLLDHVASVHSVILTVFPP